MPLLWWGHYAKMIVPYCPLLDWTGKDKPKQDFYIKALNFLFNCLLLKGLNWNALFLQFKFNLILA